MAKITKEMIARILAHVGGAANVAQAGNCMTRLRLTLRDESLADSAAIRQIDGVMGVIVSDEQFQVVLGPGKAQTAAEMMNGLLEAAPAAAPTLADVAAEKKQALKGKQTSAVQKFLAKFATIFTPLIPGFIAVGLLLGFATLAEQVFVLENAHPNASLVALIGYMKVFSKGMFTFLSILIGYNAQKAFGGSGVNGAIIASLFVLGYNPEATSGFYAGISTFFGHGIDPRGNIIGVLIAAILGAWVERQVRRVMPANLDMILTSAVTLLIMGAVTFTVIMPIGGWLFTGMSWLFLHLNGNPFWLGGAGRPVPAGGDVWRPSGVYLVYFALVDARGFARCSRSWRGRGRAEWGRRWRCSGGRSAIQRCEPRLRGDYSGLPRDWRAADLRRHLPRMETVCHRLGGACGGSSSD
ncbi:PTS N-acetylmuramic acid transporter subunit IIBC [Klebsiella pneumoniae]|nr:PTS N-acetylmuramic acid transporter subunit IIBC [Klebsiella pneumoniae]